MPKFKAGDVIKAISISKMTWGDGSNNKLVPIKQCRVMECKLTKYKLSGYFYLLQYINDAGQILAGYWYADYIDERYELSKV
jgi:hypothetical protein